MTRLLRLPADVLNIIARSLSAKELGRCSRTSRAFANAAQSGFEKITRLHAPGLALLVKPLSPGFIDWRVLCCKALRLNHRTRLKPVVNLDSVVEQANKNFHFTLETFDGDPSDPATKILSAQRAYLCAAANDRGDVEVSVEAELPNTFQRNRVAFICVYAARASKLYETAVLYSGRSTREMSRSGRAWWFAQRPAPWNDLCGDQLPYSGLDAVMWVVDPPSEPADIRAILGSRRKPRKRVKRMRTALEATLSDHWPSKRGGGAPVDVNFVLVAGDELRSPLECPPVSRRVVLRGAEYAPIMRDVDTFGNLRRHYAKHHGLRESELALWSRQPGREDVRLSLDACARDYHLPGTATVAVTYSEDPWFCSVFFTKEQAPGRQFNYTGMPFNEVIFRLEHMLVFE
jgi:hypothetical protein